MEKQATAVGPEHRTAAVTGSHTCAGTQRHHRLARRRALRQHGRVPHRAGVPYVGPAGAAQSHAEPLERCDARRAVERYGAAGASEMLALRVYTTRLLGGDPLLVLHGGGNTSLKTEMADLAGELHEVLCIKGSGRDMADIDPSGMPAVKLDPLRKLRTRDQLER